MQLSWQSACLACTKPWVWFPAPNEQSMVGYPCHSNTWGEKGPGLLWLWSKRYPGPEPLGTERVHINRKTLRFTVWTHSATVSPGNCQYYANTKWNLMSLYEFPVVTYIFVALKQRSSKGSESAVGVSLGWNHGAHKACFFWKLLRSPCLFLAPRASWVPRVCPSSTQKAFPSLNEVPSSFSFPQRALVVVLEPCG